MVIDNCICYCRQRSSLERLLNAQTQIYTLFLTTMSISNAVWLPFGAGLSCGWATGRTVFSGYEQIIHHTVNALRANKVSDI